jgi:hypothetical protein
MNSWIASYMNPQIDFPLKSTWIRMSTGIVDLNDGKCKITNSIVNDLKRAQSYHINIEGEIRKPEL